MNKINLLSILAACFFCVAIFSQCGEAKKSADHAADKTSSMADKTAEKAGKMADETSKKAGKMADDMKDAANKTLDEMDSKAGELSFEAGSWADGVLKGINSGTNTVFTLDQVPYEGEQIPAAGQEQLDNLADILKANPDWKAEIQGHQVANTKKTGGLRAKFVQGKLVFRGVKNKQLTSKGYGSQMLLTDIPAEDDRQKRVTVKISK